MVPPKNPFAATSSAACEAATDLSSEGASAAALSAASCCCFIISRSLSRKASMNLSIPSSILSHSSSDIVLQSSGSLRSRDVILLFSSNSARRSAAVIFSPVRTFSREVSESDRAFAQFIFLFIMLSRLPKSIPSIGETIDFRALQLPPMCPFMPCPHASLYSQ